MTKTRRLVVTTWVPGDVDDLHKLHSDPLTMRFVGSGRPETREECDHRLASYLNEQRTSGWTKCRATLWMTTCMVVGVLVGDDEGAGS